MAARKAGEILSVTIKLGLAEVCLAKMGLSILTYIGCLSLRDVRIKEIVSLKPAYGFHMQKSMLSSQEAGDTELCTESEALTPNLNAAPTSCMTLG